MGPGPEYTLEDQIIDERRIAAARILRLQKLEKEAQPPVVQELVLARRAAEDSRMRLGVALAYLKGDDPFRDREPEIAQEEK